MSMGFGVVALFFLAAFLLSNVIIYTRGTLGGSQKAEVNPARELVQKFLDSAVVGDYVRKGFSELKLKTSLPKPVTETEKPRGGKLVKFGSSEEISLKQAFNFMNFYPLLYEQEQYPTEFEIPIGKQMEKFQLTKKPDGTFSLEAVHDGGTVEVDPSHLQETVRFLSNPELKQPLRETIREAFLKALDERLSSQPDFKTELQSRDPSGTVTPQEMEMAFRAGRDLLVAIALKELTFEGLDPPEWLQDTYKDIDSRMQEVRDKQSKEISAEKERKLKFEFTQSMLKTSKEAIDEWEQLKTLDAAESTKKVVEEKEMGTHAKRYLTVTIHKSDQVSLKKIFKLLQFYPDIYERQGRKHTRFEVQIGGETRKFLLSKALFGVNQILVYTLDDDWPGTTKRSTTSGPWAPDYDTMVDEVLAKFPEHEKLAKAMLNAVESKLNSQPDFSVDLKFRENPQSLLTLFELL